MKFLIIAFLGMLLTGCTTPTVGQYVGGPDRCEVFAYGCHLWVKNGVTVQGVGVNLDMINGEIGGLKPPSVINKM